MRKEKIEQVITVNPLSVNMVWQGRRFKTKKYKQYEHDVYFQLPKKRISGYVEIEYTFFINRYAVRDVSNLIKPLEDIMVKRGLIEDDRFVQKFTAQKKESKENFVIITITPCK